MKWKITFLINALPLVICSSAEPGRDLGIFDVIEEQQKHTTESPSMIPSLWPSVSPSVVPTSQPSTSPSLVPTSQPSANPSSLPSISPTATPTLTHSENPSAVPSSFPSLTPSLLPSSFPSSVPSSSPSVPPSLRPTTAPSKEPSVYPSQVPSTSPSIAPSTHPSYVPSTIPTERPSSYPSSFPSSYPSSQPTSSPSLVPSLKPSTLPSSVHSSAPSETPAVKLILNEESLSTEGSQQNPKKSKSKNISAYIVIIGTSVGVVGLVIIVFLAFDMVKRRRDRRLFLNECQEESCDPESLVSNEASRGNTVDEKNITIDAGDDRSNFDPSTIQSERTSVWRKRMENLLMEGDFDGTISEKYPQSAFNASTIKSNGSWVRRTAIPTMTQQGSVMDMDFFEEKPIPDQIMCVKSDSNDSKQEI